MEVLLPVTSRHITPPGLTRDRLLDYSQSMERKGPARDRESELLQDWRNYDPPAVNELLSAAISVFLDVGYHGATVRSIAANSPLSVPGIYHHYRTKQELLVAIFDATVGDLVWRVEAAIEEAGADPVDRFALLIECRALFHANRRYSRL